MFEVIIDPKAFSLRAEQHDGETALLVKTAERSVAEGSMNLTSLDEGDVFLHLLFSELDHPNAEEEAYRERVLDVMYELLRQAKNGSERLKRPYEMNFITALYLVEREKIVQCSDSVENDGRSAWLSKLRECFGDRLVSQE